MNITNIFERASWFDWTNLIDVQSKQRKGYFPFRMEEFEKKVKILESVRRQNCKMYISQKENLDFYTDLKPERRKEISMILQKYKEIIKNKINLLKKNETQNNFDEFVAETSSIDKQRFEECLQFIVNEKERIKIEDAAEALLMLSKEKPKRISRKEMISNLPRRKSRRLELKSKNSI